MESNKFEMVTASIHISLSGQIKTSSKRGSSFRSESSLLGDIAHLSRHQPESRAASTFFHARFLDVREALSIPSHQAMTLLQEAHCNSYLLLADSSKCVKCTLKNHVCYVRGYECVIFIATLSSCVRAENQENHRHASNRKIHSRWLDFRDLPEDRVVPMNKLRDRIKKHLPKGFADVMPSGMIGYVVPHSLDPAGYHCTPSDPLPFLALASQKNSINFYHMGLYSDEKLLSWYTSEYAKLWIGKLDMGKSCIRWKKFDQIPYDLIGELVEKITPKQWVELYEKTLKK
jgi:hypothetical protein